MKFENTLTSNWQNAFRGLRNPMNSWDRSDSEWGLSQVYGDETVYITEQWIKKLYPNMAMYSPEWYQETDNIDKQLLSNGIIQCGSDDIIEYFFIGPNDMDLAQRMIAAGSPNDKFLRQIFVSVDITAPLYLWKELDTYKIGTTANSTSTMHKLASTPITRDCFEMGDFDGSLKMYDKEPYNIDEYVNDIWDNIIDYCETLRKRYVETKDTRYWKELIRILPESWLQTRTWTANYNVLRNIVKWRSTHKLTEWHQFVDWCKTLPYAGDLIFYNNKIEN